MTDKKPFGHDCEYRNFAACVEAVRKSISSGCLKASLEEARAICATLMRATEAG